MLDGIDCLSLENKGRTAIRRSKIGFVYSSITCFPDSTRPDKYRDAANDWPV